MILAEKDRLILINQFKILSLLNKNEEKYYSEKISILERGFEGMYGDVFENITIEILSLDENKFVLDVLEMYGTGMILSYKNLLNTTLTDSDLYFPGFNTDEEIKYYSFTIFFIEELERFSEIAEINKNNFRAIGNNILKYQKMLFRWKEMGKYHLSEENIRELISMN